MTVKDHFKQLAAVIKEYCVPPSNIYNWDEKGIQLGGRHKGLQGHHIFAIEDQECYISQSDSLELVLLLEAVSADGSSVPLTFVVAKTAPPRWWDVPWIGGVKVTNSGWTDDKTTLEWFMDIFIPHVQSRNASRDCILLSFNGHHSHDTPELLQVAFNNKILLYCLPPKTMHKLQPLYISVFGPLQMCRASEWHTVVHEYMEVHEWYFTPKAILSAFCRSGISEGNSSFTVEVELSTSMTGYGPI
ncbi:hypothetical protein K439DRAFT_1643828 [Ramaria rubella]|nr:hypothetical protein K439DRAFT_1643828 [Ramaria rubella]